MQFPVFDKVRPSLIRASFHCSIWSQNRGRAVIQCSCVITCSLSSHCTGSDRTGSCSSTYHARESWEADSIARCELLCSHCRLRPSAATCKRITKRYKPLSSRLMLRAQPCRRCTTSSNRSSPARLSGTMSR
jgi:hypothetical protein